MSPYRRELLAFINGEQVGVLRDQAGVWSWEYAPSWIESARAFDLAPSLPRASGTITDGGSERPVQWFFDNLLPEEGARELLARDARISSSDAFSLLAHYGKETAGAITLLAPGEDRAESGYQPLTDQELHERISGLPHHALTSGAPKRMSLAGAQHKMAVCVRDGQLFHPVGDAPSTHILKPDHRDTAAYPNSAANEYFTMRLAERMRITVPPVEIRHVPEPVYLIQRFDRAVVDTQPRRLHVIDACQLLGLDRSFKYQQSRVEMLARCISLCNSPARSRLSLPRWALFNLMIGNGDAHLKNISFLVDADGIALAPFYDLLSTECYRAESGNMPRWPATQLSMTVGTANTFASVSRDNFLQFAERLGSGRRATLRVMDEFCDTLESAAADLYEQYEGLPIPRSVRVGQLRVLRLIRLVVIRDMVARLRVAPV